MGLKNKTNLSIPRPCSFRGRKTLHIRSPQAQLTGISARLEFPLPASFLWQVLEALNILLALPRSRFEASELLSLLEVAAVRRRLDLDDTGLERIRTWVRESGVRWSEDAAMRVELGLPNEAANTWDFGLGRLFLGYASPPDSDADPCSGILPYVDVEGSEVEYLGRIQAFLDLMSAWRRRLAARRSLTEWRSAVSELLTAVFEPDDNEDARLQRAPDGLGELVSQAEAAAPTPTSSTGAIISGTKWRRRESGASGLMSVDSWWGYSDMRRINRSQGSVNRAPAR